MKVYPARVIDSDGSKCRVRLFGDDGMPTGKVLVNVPLLSDTSDETVQSLIRQYASAFPDISGNELDTAARQNLYYNSHQPVTIE